MVQFIKWIIRNWRNKEFDYTLNKAWDQYHMELMILICLVRILHFPRNLFPESMILVYSTSMVHFAKETLNLLSIVDYQH